MIRSLSVPSLKSVSTFRCPETNPPRERRVGGWYELQAEYLPQTRASFSALKFQSAMLVAAIGIQLLFVPAVSLAQSRQLPALEYYQAPFINYYQGDYREAIRSFIMLEKRAYKEGTQRWLDSICYWTMIGECHYQVGNYAEAIQFYERSIDLYLSYVRTSWQDGIQGVPQIAVDNAAVNRARINWGTPGRSFIVPRMPSSIGIMFGDMNNEQKLQTGGVIRNPEIRPADLTEIMRCTALAIYRRNVILGPTAKYYVTSNQIVGGLKGVKRQPGLFGAYNGVLLGLAQASLEDWDDAARNLATSLQFNGGMDHPLTPLALLQLAHIGMATQSLGNASQLALEASYSGAYFNQYDVIEEGLTLASQIHLIQNNTAFAPLPLAADWARRERVHRLHTSLAIRLAESFSELGMSKEAGIALAQTNQVNSRAPLSTSNLGGRVRFISALNMFQAGNFSGGSAELDAALKTYRPSSLWIFRLALTDGLTAAGGIGDRKADLLYSTLLRDPGAQDWQFDPLEAMTFLATEHLAPLERWFEVTLARGDYERALEIAELTRRHRFFSQTPFGGRTLAFRWLIHAPVETLSALAQQQRRDFLTKYPQYQTWINRTDQIQTALSLLPVLPEVGSEQAREQTKLFKELWEISQSQEALLANCGLRRVPAEMVFPPQKPMSDFRTKLEEGQGAWVCFATGRGYHRFLIRQNQVQYLGMVTERDLQRPLTDLMKKMGVSENVVDVSLLNSDDWKAPQKILSEKLFQGTSLIDLSQLKELVIVPDGILWYFPFEIAQVVVGDTSANLIDKVDIRYSPTLFLAYDGQRPQREVKNKAVAIAKVHSRLDPVVNQNAFNELIAAEQDVLKLESLAKKAQPELLATQIDQLLVWNEIDPARNSGLDISPLDLPQANDSPLRLWLLLPWRAPEYMVLPVFQSDAAHGFRAKRRGTELFMSSLGMMAAGSRSMLISRWRTGGANSLAFSRSYFQRLTKMSTAQAFKESLAAAKEMNLNYSIEPLVRSKSNDAAVKATHPFFWAPYMRFDIPMAAKPEAVEVGLNPDPDQMLPDDKPPSEIKLPEGEMEKKPEGELKKKDDAGNQNKEDQPEPPTQLPGEGKKDG